MIVCISFRIILRGVKTLTVTQQIPYWYVDAYGMFYKYGLQGRVHRYTELVC